MPRTCQPLSRIFFDQHQFDRHQNESIVTTGKRLAALGGYNGTLRSTPATELGATVVRESLPRSGLDPARIDNVVMGNVIRAGNLMYLIMGLFQPDLIFDIQR